MNKLKIDKAMIICRLDKHGNVQRVNYNNQVRDQYPVTPLDETYKLYKALKRFNDIAYDKKVMIKHKLRPGKNFQLTVFFELLFIFLNYQYHN